MSATFGIELEVSDLSIPAARYRLNLAGLNDWETKPDGTRNVSAEAVSPILDYSQLQQGSIAARALLSGGATVNRQTGYHVHLGANHYGIEGIALLVQNWNLAHATIGALVAPSRLNNNFCKAVDLSELDNWVEHVRNGNIQNYRSGRYYSLNLAAYSQHTTVEFRLHHGTLNGSKIKAWAQFCHAVAEFSKAGNVLDSQFSAVTDSADRLNKVAALLELLTIAGCLEPQTSTYLKARAGELNA